MSYLCFPIGMADAIANIIFQEYCIDLAITLGRALGPYGIAHYLLTAAEHQQRFGVSPNRLLMPAPYDDPQPLPMANRRREFTMFDNQETAYATLEQKKTVSIHGASQRNDAGGSLVAPSNPPRTIRISQTPPQTNESRHFQNETRRK